MKGKPPWPCCTPTPLRRSDVEIGKARREAAAAIAVCITCPVRAQCLTMSLRHWDIGQHGVWGGMVAAERMALRRSLYATATTQRTTWAEYANAPAAPAS